MLDLALNCCTCILYIHTFICIFTYVCIYIYVYAGIHSAICSFSNIRSCKVLVINSRSQMHLYQLGRTCTCLGRTRARCRRVRLQALHRRLFRMGGISSSWTAMCHPAPQRCRPEPQRCHPELQKEPTWTQKVCRITASWPIFV